MRAVVVFSGMYLLLFALHIVFAAKDWNLLFCAVATSLVAMTFLCGPVLWFMVNRLNFSGTNPTKLGYFLSLPLATGIAYGVRFHRDGIPISCDNDRIDCYDRHAWRLVHVHQGKINALK